MPIEITMPRLSDTMEKGTIVKWHVAAGDPIGSGDVLADVETDKATMEMQAYDDGTMASIMIGEGEAVEIGTVLAIMTEEDESLEDLETPAAAPAAPAEPEQSDPAPAAPAAVEQPKIETPQVSAPSAPAAASVTRRAARIMPKKRGIKASQVMLAVLFVQSLVGMQLRGTQPPLNPPSTQIRWPCCQSRRIAAGELSAIGQPPTREALSKGGGPTS